MNDSELRDKDVDAVRYLGKRYIKFPWAIINRMLDANQRERRLGFVHMVLFVSSNFMDGKSVVNGKVNVCDTGEFVSTHEDLAALLDLSTSTLRRCVQELREAGLVDIDRASDASRFHVNGYEAFMRGTETGTFPQNSPGKNHHSAEKLKEEELRRFGDQKPRTDLLD